MESENLIITSRPTIRERMLASAGPLLWIAISYVDPGKWAAVVEGGARFGLDLFLLLLVINFAAIMYQYLSACVAIATGKDLSQVCSEEYDDTTCILLGVLVEISMIALDLTMVLSTAYGLNAVFGIDIFNCVFLTGFDAIFFPLLSSLFENPRAKFLSTCLASFILVSCIFGLCISQPESSFPVGGMLTKLNGESAYALMSLLGANIMPYNFFLHSSAVKLTQGKLNLSKGTLCQDHFFAIICIFSGIFLLNYMLMNLAANVLYGTGLVLLTLQDALSLLDQVFRNSVPSAGLIFIVFCSSQLIALRWYLGRQVIIQDLFKTDIPGWLHRATIRIIAIIPALYCVRNTGAEGIFQLLIFTQVLVGLLLPSSAISLFRIASSKSIMGSYKIPMLVEFFTIISFVGILGIKIVFVVEMIFGSSEWVSSLKWNIGNSVPLPYLILLVGAFSSLCLMLWLGTTPLKSASSTVDAQALIWDVKTFAPEPCADGDQTESCASQHNVDSAREQQELELSFDSFGDNANTTVLNADLKLPETLTDTATHLNTVQEIKYEVPSPGLGSSEVSATTREVAVPLSLHNEVLESKPQVASSLSAESEKTSPKVEHLPPEKGDEVDHWEPEESTKDVPDGSQSLASDGPGSFRSLSGKSDEIGSGAGSLSRLAGLGRAARRQLTITLDEFWGQLFDFHGQTTQEAKSKKLDVLLGTDPKVDIKSSLAPMKLDSTCKDSTGYIPASGRGPDSLRNSSFYNSPKQQIAQSGIGSPLGVHKGSSMWSPSPQLLDAYVRNSSHAPDSGERRYHSVHVPAASDGYNQQPATVHGYDLALYLGRTAVDKGSDYQVDQLESLKRMSTMPIKSNSKEFSRGLVQKPQNGLRTLTPPGFHNVPVSRNNSLNIERPFHEHPTTEHVDFTNNPADLKKFYSLPDISGLYVPHQDSSLTSNHDNFTGYGQSISRLAREQTYQSASSWAGASIGYSELSPSKVCRDAFSLQFSSGLGASSLWSKQPYERFGVADKPPSSTQETASIVEFEAKLLQSFRSCIMKLLKLEGFDWLFRQNDGTDEDLIDRVAARERVLSEVEARAIDRKLGSAIKNDDADHTKLMSVPNCGEGCVWRADIVVSFGVWCIHRILELSLMESRPELWGKYTYVLNRLQGIIDLAFTKPRSPPVPCFCLEIPPGYERKSSPSISNGSLPPTAKMARGKFTTAAMLLDMIKDVEIAISCRKGRTGTAAGDVAFPKGKENLASVLKRYKRRLSNKPVGSQEAGHGSRKL
ncbi:ethylene-insensitive protein 2-like [Dorcoceras hygrometricum]|uniref:Ethylene-insensitive protein 2-like n=1 Tax=Dorcoceras hygrometricum TaxID=472368 RepID=A0A2Z7AYX7_9LAMI|nr:ethylene-insensitive protein 2-like [Dorcoceras hygrometricum]